MNNPGLLLVSTVLVAGIFPAHARDAGPRSSTVLAQVSAGDAQKSAAKQWEGREFEPPPIPEFMLRKLARPLTQEQMQRQADEAAERARKARPGGAGSSSEAVQPPAAVPASR